jgi:hypothetical protein
MVIIGQTSCLESTFVCFPVPHAMLCWKKEINTGFRIQISNYESRAWLASILDMPTPGWLIIGNIYVNHFRFVLDLWYRNTILYTLIGCSSIYTQMKESTQFDTNLLICYSIHQLDDSPTVRLYRRTFGAWAAFYMRWWDWRSRS